MHSVSSSGMYWKPGDTHPRLPQEVDRESRVGTGFITSMTPGLSRLSIDEQRRALPIFKLKKEILYLLDVHDSLILIGETGSGKSTQIPQFLYDAGYGRRKVVIGITQPRRMAAISIAERIAREMRSELGSLVGYSIRFDHNFSKDQTKILFLTDGMLLREALLDPLLSKFSVVVVDEAHERSVSTDILLGLLKKVQSLRKDDFKIIISSATLPNVEEFAHFLRNPAKISVEGRQYPVDIYHSKAAVSNYVRAAGDLILDIHRKSDISSGDILVFLTGAEDIEKCANLVGEELEKAADMSLSVLLLHGSMQPKHQMRVFEVHHNRRARRVIISTNVSESSVTIPNIVYVIDAGFVKMPMYDSLTTLDALCTRPISKSSAMQRAGRAGRIKPGKVYRLYTEEAYRDMEDTTTPEIQRCNFGTVLMQLKGLGIHNVMKFPFLSYPPRLNVERGLELLYALGAVDDSSSLTDLGARISEMGLDSMLGRVLLDSPKYSCSEDVLTICAMLSVRGIFVDDFRMAAQTSARIQSSKEKFAVREGDHITYLNVYKAFLDKNMNEQWCHQQRLSFKALSRANEIRRFLKGYLRKYGIPSSTTPDANTIVKCIFTGFFPHAAYALRDGSYRMVRDRAKALYIHPNSVLSSSHPPWILFHDVILTSKYFMTDVSAIDKSWLAEVAPHYYKSGTEEDDTDTKRRKIEG